MKTELRHTIQMFVIMSTLIALSLCDASAQVQLHKDVALYGTERCSPAVLPCAPGIAKGPLADAQSARKSYLAWYEGVRVNGQCVDFARRFAAAKLNSAIPTIGQYHPCPDCGAHWIWDDARLQPTNIVRIANDGSNCPQRWDIIVWKREYYVPWGHIAIVDSASGRGSVTVVESNHDFSEDGDVRSFALDSRVAGWFRPGGSPPPPPPPVNEFVSESSLAPNDGAAGFWRHGTAGYWKSDSVGESGHMFWVLNNDPGHGIDNMGDWRPNLPQSGRYEVYVFIPCKHATTQNAQYEIYHADGRTDKHINQLNYSDEWVSLGTYRFNAGTSNYLRLIDMTPETYISKYVGFDAAKWEKRADPSPVPNSATELSPRDDARQDRAIRFTWRDNRMSNGQSCPIFKVQVWRWVDGHLGDLVWNDDFRAGTTRDWTAPGPGKYMWEVHAGNGIDRSEPSESAWFVVRAIPNAPTELNPSGGAVVLSSINFSWYDNGMDDGNLSADFKVQVWKRSGGQRGEIVLDTEYASGTTRAWTAPDDGEYEWEVRAHNGVDRDTGSAPASFVVQTEPRVTAPDAVGVRWCRGRGETITWRSFNGGQVKLEVWKGTSLERVISHKTPNDGKFIWRVPGDLPWGNDYKIRVVERQAPWRADLSNHEFSVSGPRVTCPDAEGVTWYRGESRRITWRDFSGSTVRIQLWKAGRLSQTISRETPNDGQFWWRVPVKTAPGNDYSIRVSQTQAPWLPDFSNHNFRISGPRVTYPDAAGLNLGRGQPCVIKWGGFTGGKVRIKLYVGGQFVRVISRETANDGQFRWWVPDNLLPGSHYRIRISACDYSCSPDFSNNDFKILGPRVTHPSAAGLSFRTGEPCIVQWKEFTGAKVSIELYNGKTLARIITRGTPNDGRFGWQVPGDLPPGNHYRFRIAPFDHSCTPDFSNNNFTITGPKVVYPSAAGISLARGQSFAIKWRGFTGDKVSIELHNGPNVAWIITRGTANDGQLWWRVPSGLPTGTQYRIRIAPFDGSCPADRSNNYFRVSAAKAAVGSTLVISSAQASQGAAGATISYSLSAAADVEVTILNVAGRPVRRLSAGSPSPAGMGSVIWNLASDTGTRVPQGLYLCTVQARGADGQTQSVMLPMTVAR